MSDDLFKDIPWQLSSDEAAGLSQLRWEETMVTRMLKFYEQEYMAKVFRKRCFEATGFSRLLFTWFQDEFGDFPVWLVFRRVRYLHQLTMEDFLGRFTQTAPYRAYEEARESVPEAWMQTGRPTGLVFEYIHGMGAAILTDCERPLGEQNTRIVKCVRGQCLYFEPFREFLEALAWQPSR